MAMYGASNRPPRQVDARKTPSAQAGLLTVIIVGLGALASTPAAADLHVEYFFAEHDQDAVRAGEETFTNGTVTPLKASVISEIQYDVFYGAEAPAERTTGWWVVPAQVAPFFRRPATVYFNSEIVGCKEPIEGENCIPPGPGVELVEYDHPVPDVTNSVVFRFANANEEGGLASIGPGEVEIVAINWQSSMRTKKDPLQDGLIVVGGSFNTQAMGKRGDLGENGTVTNWTGDFSGRTHSQILCTGAFCASSLESPGACHIRHDLEFFSTALHDGDLIIVNNELSPEDEIPLQIAAAGDDPATCVTGTVQGQCPLGFEVPASFDMTFADGYSSVAFDIFQRCTGDPGDHRVFYHFEGTEAVIVPEPAALTLQAGALALLGAIYRRRRTANARRA